MSEQWGCLRGEVVGAAAYDATIKLERNPFDIGDTVYVTRYRKPGDPDEARQDASAALRTLLTFYAEGGHGARDLERVVSAMNLIEPESW